MFDVKFLDKSIIKTLRNKKSLVIDDEKYKIVDFNERILDHYEEIQKDEWNYSLQLRKYKDEPHWLIFGQKIGNEYLYDAPLAYLIKK